MLKFILLISCIVSVVLSKELPQGIKKCKRNDPELSNCIKDSMHMAFKLLVNGLPEYGIKSIEPLLIDGFESEATNPKAVFAVNQKYKNMKFSGLSGVIVKNLKATLTNEKCEIKLKTLQPYLEIYGDYEVKGKALVFQLNGKGKANITATDVASKTVISCEFYKKDNEEFIRFTNTKLEILDMKTVHLDLENIFDGNKELSKSINTVLNENGIETVKELSAGFNKAFSAEYFRISNKLVEGIPVNKLFD